MSVTGYGYALPIGVTGGSVTVTCNRSYTCILGVVEWLKHNPLRGNSTGSPTEDNVFRESKERIQGISDN